MRNPIYIFPIGILSILALSVVSVAFGMMSAEELWAKFKDILIVLIPVGIIFGVFAFSQWKDGKRGS